MNARKTKTKVPVTTKLKAKTHLRVLSEKQRKQVNVIAADWKEFTDEVHLDMFDKI